MLEKFKRIFSSKEILTKIIYTLLILLVFKIGTFIPTPMIDTTSIGQIMENNSFLSILNAFSGGGLSNFSILALGISPYITASIVIQMSQMVIPKLKELTEQGGNSKQKINKITRYVAVVLAFVQALAILFSLGQRPENILVANAIANKELFWLYYLYMALVITAGSCFTIWLADLITKKGIGNGSSMIIGAGILSTLPAMFGTLYDKYIVSGISASNVTLFITVIILYILMICAVVYFEGAKRKIPVQYANRANSGRADIPIKLNSASVIPVIFASTLLSIPLTIVGMFGQTPESSTPAYWIDQIFSYNQPIGIFLYIILIYFFSFFYSFLMVDPEKIAENLDRSGAYIPGFRRGEETKNQIARILFKTTLIGSTYLVLLALVPIIVSKSFGFTQQEGSIITIGGTSLIIIVGVALETMKQLETSSQKDNYKRLF